MKDLLSISLIRFDNFLNYPQDEYRYQKKIKNESENFCLFFPEDNLIVYHALQLMSNDIINYQI